MKQYCILLIMIVTGLKTLAQQPDTTFLKNLLQSHPELFQGILNHPTHNEVQILYTQIDRDKNNIPHFKSFSYRLNPKRYFYPASTVKLPTCIFALEKINELKIKAFTKSSAMITDSAFAGQTKVKTDTSSTNGLPSIENYIKKILLVSDNDAYNRLYEFVGREEINQKLKKYQLNNTRIIGRLAINDTGEGTKHTNPIDFYNGDKLVYQKPALYDSSDYPMQLDNMLQGKGYLDKNDKLIMQPFDFSQKNVYTIADQQMVLKRLLFPETFDKAQRFNLTPADYRLIYKYMSMFPTESTKPTYNRPQNYPVMSKLLFYGADSTAAPDANIRIFNKYGDSYGYNIDNAYIVDFKNNVEFLLTAVVQSNEDGIYNDNKYEYATVCLPFLKNLGQVIYQHELHRPKKNKHELPRIVSNYTN
ncbi:serine hydrolase [Mucilaginibacter sp. KACC 22773]|uniref:serine hydrolase n=1 Tax=Mucilaginibacter sp. KACC 22773 TaxID=3025671 RepID=UPI00236561AD|nr:serine hydrolase [Mucilaginibacter sp. KACC 22773]WDF80477.1 serine hydrolase [Mucilaginibacter sp. KACC 22773]